MPSTPTAATDPAECTPWARRYTVAAWARVLTGPARHGWVPRDVNQLIRDWIGVGHWLPDNPHKPIGLLSAMLAWHGDLADRPAAADIAREAAERAAHHTHLTAQPDPAPHAETGTTPTDSAAIA